MINTIVLLILQPLAHFSIYPPYRTLIETTSYINEYNDVKFEDLDKKHIPSAQVIANYKFKKCLPEKSFDVFLSYLPNRNLDLEFIVEYNNGEGLSSKYSEIRQVGTNRLEIDFQDYIITLNYEEGQLKEVRDRIEEQKIRVGIIEKEVLDITTYPMFFKMLEKYLKIKDYAKTQVCS